MKPKIVRSFSPATVTHRGAITVCPHCGHNADDWEKTASLLALTIVHGKHGAVVVVSECPKCFEKSWVHQPFSFFSDYHEMYSEEWKSAVQDEHTRRHVAAVSTFADSQCAKCAHLRKLECDTLPIVQCTEGDPKPAVGRKAHLHHSFTKTDCAKFSPRPLP